MTFIGEGGMVSAGMHSADPLSALMREYYDRLFLTRAKPQLVMQDIGQKRPIPLNSGKVIFFTRYLNLPAATTPLTEGTNPTTARGLSAVEISGTFAEYGDYGKISSLMSLVAVDPNLKSKVEIFSDQAALTMETLLRNNLIDSLAVSAQGYSASASIQLANGKGALSAITATDVLACVEIRKALRRLKKQKALKEAGRYVCVINPDTEYDFTGDEAWVNASEYAGSRQLFEGEIGTWFGVRFLMCSEPYVVGSTVDVYSNFICGREAFGVIPLAGQGQPKIIVKVPGEQDTSNPLNRYSTIGWVVTFGSKMLRPEWMVDIRTGVTP